MAATAHPLPSIPHDPAAPCLIAADVGGTHVRIGLVTGDHADAPLSIHGYRKYICADYSGLDEILADFIASLGGQPVQAAAIASAGHALEDGTVISRNLPWTISLPQLQQRLGIADLRLVNDFEAVAHATDFAGNAVQRLTGPATAADGPVLVIGPGTGLGAAVRIPARPHPIVLPTEAGQAALTTGNAMEARVLQEFLRERSHVPNEHALSGPGLMHLHGALCAIEGVDNRYRLPSAVTAAAIDGSDPLARRTLEMFCGLLGSTVGDMALLYGAHGGIYLAGGILPQLREFLLQSSFVERFLNKGPMRAVLERIPVTLVEHGQLGVMGAANWYLARRGDASHQASK